MKRSNVSLPLFLHLLFINSCRLTIVSDYKLSDMANPSLIVLSPIERTILFIVHPNLHNLHPRPMWRMPNQEHLAAQTPYNAHPIPVSSMPVLTQLPIISLREPAHSLRLLHNFPPFITLSIFQRQTPPFAMKPLLFFPPLFLRLSFLLSL